MLARKSVTYTKICNAFNKSLPISSAVIDAELYLISHLVITVEVGVGCFLLLAPYVTSLFMEQQEETLCRIRIYFHVRHLPVRLDFVSMVIQVSEVQQHCNRKFQ